MNIKLSLIQKISLSGILLALIIIFTRILSVQNVPVIPFVRISLGPALIIFSSLLLGPVFGMFIGGLSDILGIVLFPNSLGYGINPWFTLVYAILGLAPGLLVYALKYIKSEKIMFISIVSVLSALFIFVMVFLLINTDITLFGKNYHFEIWHKIVIISVSLVLTIGTILGIYLINKHYKDDEKRVPIYKVTFISIISEFLILLIANSIVKMIFFETDFLVIVFSQAIVFFINILLDAFVVTNLLELAKRTLKTKKG